MPVNKSVKVLEVYLSAYDTYGIRKTPLRFGRGIVMHKEQTKRSTRGIFTQVRAAQKRKTLLLLSYIMDVSF